ncbi:L-seryl-tRNA(Sec) selenium transferase [Nakamurella endophytica]|uniref:L-seryl-tRNA(Sec) selenium transferase n=1 Tax=Nakamurella endophytica TaxID=1748367 RepID=A0A917T080_9ACTN|nr:L-seryl-tRNA(Sec) selenium transferase [Nakamurella endophytica]GGM06213.1 L-seryl-tRNA(Sec) selenium transferase [Nakamurella endophytica]
MTGAVDRRRDIPRTDALLADPRLVAAARHLGRGPVKAAVTAAQQEARRGGIAPQDVAAAALTTLAALAAEPAPGVHAVLNATGVVLHTNLGRAPLSAAARAAVQEATGYVDVEFDLAGGRRARRGRTALEALLAAVPEAEAALVVNNGAAALLLAVSALAAGRTVLVSRGELVEIGDGFRLPDLIETTGARIREVGTTNCTTVADYTDAADESVACLLKIHPSNFRVVGFGGTPSTAELATTGLPLVVDIGSGLLSPDPAVPDEMDARSTLRDGAALVTGSGDKLLGGPQAGIVLGRADVVERLRRHPVARAVRADKLSLAALEATVRAGHTPTLDALHADPAQLRRRCEALAGRLPGAAVVPSDGAVGGGSGTGVVLPGWAVAVDERLAGPLRCGTPPVVGRVAGGRLLLDLRCVPPDRDDDVARAVAAAQAVPGGDGRSADATGPEQA